MWRRTTWPRVPKPNFAATATGIIQQSVAYENALIARDVSLYASYTGLASLVAGVKIYVKAPYGPSSAQYKVVNALSFHRIRA